MLSIVNKTKKQIPNLPLKQIADQILGSDYQLELVFVNDQEIQSLNRRYRRKDYPTNILSFPLEKNEGEILINLEKAKKEAPDFNHDNKNHLIFLFIHGCLHLNGLTHGSIMTKEEKKFFQIYGSPNNNRIRHRDRVTTRRSVRIQKGR